MKRVVAHVPSPGCVVALIRLFVAMGALPAALNATAAAGRVPARPNGAVNLAQSSVRQSGAVTCGQVKGRWLPGTRLRGGYFISDTQQASDYQALARRATGKAKRSDLAAAKRYAKRAKANLARCTPHVRVSAIGQRTGTVGAAVWLHITASASDRAVLRYSATGLPAGITIASKTGAITGVPRNAGIYLVTITVRSGTGAVARVSFRWLISASGGGGGGGGGGGTPLRFNVRGAIGLALAAPRAGAAADRTTRVSSAGSNLETVSAAGHMSDAVSSGTATISHFLIAPGGKLYVLFSQRTNLADTSAFSGAGCLLAQVDPASGTPTCIDQTLQWINWANSGPVEQSAAIQFDDSGAIYYSGTDSSGRTVLRKYAGGVSTDLITDNVSLDHFLVLGDGTVVISGMTTSTSERWTRRISPSGALKSLRPTASNFLARFPDGNVYMGMWNTGNLGVERYLPASDQVDPTFWIGGSVGGNEPDTFDAPSICTAAHVVSNPFCSWYGSWVSWSFATSDGNEFVGASGLTTVPMEYYPTVRFLSSEVTNVTVALGVINQLVLAGLNSQSQHVLTLYNTSTDTEQELLGPDDEIEIYHLSYVPGSNSVLFDGLRFSDNKYVIGEYQLSTHTMNEVATSAVRWSDLQAF